MLVMQPLLAGKGRAAAHSACTQPQGKKMPCVALQPPVWRRPSRGYSFKGCKTALLRRADAFVAWAHWDETAHSLLALKLLATAMSQFNIHYNNTTGSGKPKTRSKISKYWAATLLPVHALQRINSRVPTTYCVPALTEGYPASPLLTAGCSATPPHRAATRPLQ